LRLWSIHPKYLDYKGLVAVWREGLLAKRVLMGETKEYRDHPQLLRLKGYEKTSRSDRCLPFQLYGNSTRKPRVLTLG